VACGDVWISWKRAVSLAFASPRGLGALLHGVGAPLLLFNGLSEALQKLIEDLDTFGELL
jgi:hypothetical protein